MIADHQTNVVFVADTLERRFPAVYGRLKTILSEHGIPFRTIPGTRDIRCRDYMPVQVAKDRFVQFRYTPDYLNGKYRHLRAYGKLGPSSSWVKNCYKSEIVLDGGNIVKWSDKVVLIEKILSENPTWSRKALISELRKLLKDERIILIGQEPGDVTGHADGMTRFLNSETVVLNDYREVDQVLRKNLISRFEKNGLNKVEIPYRPEACSFQGMPPAEGSYINFIETGPLLIIPSYGLAEDQVFAKILAEIVPKKVIECIPCFQLARNGGVLTCITCNYYMSSD